MSVSRPPPHDFGRCRRGNFAVTAAMLAPVLLGLLGGAVDLLIFQHHRSELQATADSAVLAAATEAGLKGWSAESAKQVAASVIASNLTNKFSDVMFAYDVHVDEPHRTVKLELTQDHYGYFFLGYFMGSPQIGVRAVAKAAGQATICLIAQSPNKPEAIELTGSARVHASGCSAYSNSSSSKGMTVEDGSWLKTQLACTAGGYKGKPGSFSPLPLTDCPTLADPLAIRAKLLNELASDGACQFKKIELKAVNKSLTPGTYCNGLEISEGSKVQFLPGIYVVKNGKMKVDKFSTVQGTGVGFVFVGEKAKVEFKNDSTISMSAPESGPMAGILMYAQPVAGKQREFKIESKDAKKLIGTVYLPYDYLTVGGDKDGDGVCDPETGGPVVPAPTGTGCISDVGAASSWTAIIVNMLKVTAGATLVLNSDYSASSVPVPDGIGPNSTRTLLVN